MKKQWIKACMAVLTMGLLALGVAGCSGGKIFGIQIGGNNENNEEFDFSQLTNKYPIPDPIRTPEEIKAAGGEVTVEDVENAFEYFTYKVTTGILGDADVVSSRFISITPAWLPGREPGKFEKVYEPFYTLVSEDKYYICLNMDMATGISEIPFENKIYFPAEFEEILEIFGAEEHIITDAYLRQFKDSRYGRVGEKAHDGITIDFTNIGELEPEEREVVITFLNYLSQDIEKLYECPNPAPGHENN